MFYTYLLGYRNNLLSCTVFNSVCKTHFLPIYCLVHFYMYQSHASTLGENITKLESLNTTEIAEFISAYFTKWERSVGLH